MGPVLSNKLRPTPFADLTDVTLVDEDTKAMVTDNANRAIQGNVAMHVTHQVNLVVKFRTNASSPIWWQNVQLMQVALSGGQIWNQFKWCHLVVK